MRKKRILLGLTSVLFWLCFLVTGLLAYHFFWFWKYSWFDLIVHFLAGVSLGLAGLIVYFYIAREDGLPIVPTWSYSLLVTIVTVMVIGGLWELFEFSIDGHWVAYFSVKQLAFFKTGTWDTVTDLLADFAGGLVGGLLYNLFGFLTKGKIATE